MSWKKNVFSYLMWFVYASLVTAALVSLGNLYCTEAGTKGYYGTLLAVVYMAAAGGIVFLLRKLAPEYTPILGKCRAVLMAAEIALVVVFLALGVELRVRGMEGVLQSSEYYDTAMVAAGQGLPQAVHGAVYLYLLALREVFLLVGNHFMAGIWFQTALQLLGAFFLFFAVRKLAGRLGALTLFGFCMCAPFMVQGALVLSPEMLYFFLFSFAALLISMAWGGKRKPVPLCLAALVAAVCCYMDIVGILLFLMTILIAISRREEEGDGSRKEGLLYCLAVTALFLLGLAACVFSDAALSGKTFEGVLGAWLRLYRPESFRLPLTVGSAGSGVENLVLFGMLAFGVFSFWCHRSRERISAGIAAAALLVPGMCYGILTEEMPGFQYLYLLLTLLAGVGLEQCFQPPCAEEKKDEAAEEAGKPEKEKSPEKETESETQKNPEKTAGPEAEKGQGEAEAPKGEKKETEAKSEESSGKAVEPKPEEDSEKAEEKKEKLPWWKRRKKEKKQSQAEHPEKEVSAAENREESQKEKEAAEARQKEAEELEKEKALKEEFRREAARLKEEKAQKETERTEQEKEKPGQEGELPKQGQQKEEQEHPEEKKSAEGKKRVKYLENPLPLPRKHKKRVMEYSRHIPANDDFDHPVAENDDFDI